MTNTTPTCRASLSGRGPPFRVGLPVFEPGQRKQCGTVQLIMTGELKMLGHKSSIAVMFIGLGLNGMKISYPVRRNRSSRSWRRGRVSLG